MTKRLRDSPGNEITELLQGFGFRRLQRIGAVVNANETVSTAQKEKTKGEDEIKMLGKMREIF